MSETVTSHETVLQLENVGVSYQRRLGLFHRQVFWALKDVTFSVYKGESLGIIGRNGAGKSTLLKLLAGIINPSIGTIERKEARADLLSLQLGFIPHLSGRENAILSGMLLGIPRRRVESSMEEIIAFSELEAFIDQPLKTYSSGMKARLGFAVAFQCNPDILLIDEVLGVGDAQFKQKSAELLRQKIKSDKTVIIVSHSASVIKDLCDRAVWIEHGEARAEGPAADVLTQYQRYIRGLATQHVSHLLSGAA